MSVIIDNNIISPQVITLVDGLQLDSWNPKEVAYVV